MDVDCNMHQTEEIPNTLSGLFMDHFDPLTMMDVDRSLGYVKAATCSLNSCPSWLLKS